MGHKKHAKPSPQEELEVTSDHDIVLEEVTEEAQKPIETTTQDHRGETETVVDGTRESTSDDEEKAVLQEQLLRARAEIENVRRRAERDVANAHKYALERFVDELLPVLDSLDQAQAHSFANAESKRIHEGVALTISMFLNVLKKFGVECIDPLHAAFDPNRHEAMSMTENKEFEPNTVTQVLQKGYLLNGRLIRPARVFINQRAEDG